MDGCSAENKRSKSKGAGLQNFFAIAAFGSLDSKSAQPTETAHFLL